MAKISLKDRSVWRILALIRVCVAFVLLALFAAAYLAPPGWKWLLSRFAGAQFAASLYDDGILSAGVLAYIVIAIVVGRVYCSILCPMGTLQELFWRIALRFQPRRSYYVRPSAARYAVPLLTGVGLVFAVPALMMFADPISNFGRGMGAIYSLLWNERTSAFTVAIAAPCAAILLVSAVAGRRFCDWCPVGMTLGVLSSVAPFGMRIRDGCVSCGLCERKCPMGCADAGGKRIEKERCVLCFSCAAACQGGFISWGYAGVSAASAGSRRLFLRGAGVKVASFVAGAFYLTSANFKFFRDTMPPAGGEAAMTEENAAIEGDVISILPPGALDVSSYASRCVGCMACVAACPVKIIKTLNSANPALDYSGDFCQYSCVECGKVCPTHAIHHLSVEEKRRTRVALSNLTLSRCVVVTKGQACGACAEVCPTRSLKMVSYEGASSGLTVPDFAEPYCIGCGACLVVCPAEPAAFSVDAAQRQSLTPGIRPTEGNEDLPELPDTNDFPF
ncbi:MAG: 4Fe-4S binding protein [Synergistaceae bacterium]|jgi:ferredoxin|nr:4Fe-4S binding protein [Synergistaceae bacterium]